MASLDRRVEELDILRGLAALAVVLFHVRVPLWAGWYEVAGNANYPAVDRALAWLGPPMAFFGTTVMLFFVVSGFAIHYAYAAPGAVVEPRPYAARRFFRIYPSYLAVVLLTVGAERLVAAIAGTAPSPGERVAASLAMMQNYVPPAGQLSANPSLWSLPVEIELYLIYPLLFWFWRRAGLAVMLAVVSATSAAAAAALVLGYQWPMGNFAKYWIIWVSGAVLAELFRSGRLPRWRVAYTVALAAGVPLAVAARLAGLAFGLEHFLWGGIYFLAVLWVLHHRGLHARLPLGATRALSWLGRISYSLYLVHFPVLVVAGACWVAVFGSKPSNILVPIVMSTVTLPVAYLVWRLVERPSMSLGRTLAGGDRRPVHQPVVTGPGPA